MTGATGLFPLTFLARRVWGEKASTAFMFLYPTLPSVTLFAVSSADWLFAALAAWSLWLAIEAVEGRSRVLAIAAGIVGGLSATFTFAQGFIGFVVALFAVGRYITRDGTLAPRQVLWMAIGLVGWYSLLRWGFGFDWFEALRVTHRWHAHVIRAEAGAVTPVVWLYTSVGNLVVFAIFLGVPVATSALLAIGPLFRPPFWTDDPGRQLSLAVFAVLTLMTFGGLFILEVERIWIFLTGPVLLAAIRPRSSVGDPNLAS